ncbi:MAG: hypothetical protein ING75_16860 [Rhodocyclaceae bacterium]|nr:hypothetical protein [Rhodocyclaceae bacterium]
MQNLVAERMLTAPKMRLYFDHFYSGCKYDFRKLFLAWFATGKTVAVQAAGGTFSLGFGGVDAARVRDVMRDVIGQSVRGEAPQIASPSQWGRIQLRACF